MRTTDNTCCFTGHRDISKIEFSELVKRMDGVVLPLIEKGYKYFACGGAIGFDTFAEFYILALRERGYDVKLVLMLPCLDQTARWNNSDKTVYESLKLKADEVIYVSERNYFAGCMQKRNRALVDASSCCISYLYEDGHSGTRQTVDYANGKGMVVYNLA